MFVRDFRFAFYCEQQEWTRQLLYFYHYKRQNAFHAPKTTTIRTKSFKTKIKKRTFYIFKIRNISFVPIGAR